MLSKSGLRCEIIQMKSIKYSNIIDLDDDYDIWFEDVELCDDAIIYTSDENYGSDIS